MNLAPSVHAPLAHRPEAVAACNGLSLAFETFGDPADPTLLLIAGLGCQMLMWDEAFCQRLAAHGFHVVRFDNRDMGHSTRLGALGVPDLSQVLVAAGAGRPMAVPYLLRDMAADAVALLDALGVQRAHVVGASMGGAIAQEIALHWPARVHSLVSIMSTTGEPGLPGPTPEAMAVLMAAPPATIEDFCRHYAKSMLVLRGAGFAADDAADPQRALAIWTRGINPPGTARQLAAIVSSPPRRAALGAVRAPTLVIHGSADPLIPHPCGQDTAAAIPGARLLTIPGMGHALPIALWPTLVDTIVEHARTAQPDLSTLSA